LLRSWKKVSTGIGTLGIRHARRGIEDVWKFVLNNARRGQPRMARHLDR
jgi:hypothetical protein